MSSSEILDKEFIDIRQSLVKTIARMIPPQDVEDIVQETYIKVCQSAKRIEQPRPFMFKVAKNLALDYLKSARFSKRVYSEDDDQEPLDLSDARDRDQVFNEVDSKQQFLALCDAVSTLPKQARKAFVLKKIYGYSQREIAQEMQLSESTVEKHIALGLRHCKRVLADQNSNSTTTNTKTTSTSTNTNTNTKTTSTKTTNNQVGVNE